MSGTKKLGEGMPPNPQIQTRCGRRDFFWSPEPQLNCGSHSEDAVIEHICPTSGHLLYFYPDNLADPFTKMDRYGCIHCGMKIPSSVLLVHRRMNRGWIP